MFDDLAIALHETAVEKGFWPEEVDDILNDSYDSKAGKVMVKQVSDI